MKPRFLGFEEVLEIHRDQIERYGGSAGIRDAALLRSALGMPSAGMAGEHLHTDLIEMAAAYVFHIVKNHPFVDGNKRVGAVAALVFLELNGFETRIPEVGLFDLIMGVAKGEISKSQVADFLRKYCSS
jgi:death-on-curing protein